MDCRHFSARFLARISEPGVTSLHHDVTGGESQWLRAELCERWCNERGRVNPFGGDPVGAAGSPNELIWKEENGQYGRWKGRNAPPPSDSCRDPLNFALPHLDPAMNYSLYWTILFAFLLARFLQFLAGRVAQRVPSLPHSCSLHPFCAGKCLETFCCFPEHAREWEPQNLSNSLKILYPCVNLYESISPHLCACRGRRAEAALPKRKQSLGCSPEISI